MKLSSGWFRRKLAVCSVFFLLFAAVMVTAPAQSSAFVSVGVSVTIAPPPIPVYVQPLCPGPGFIWVPGYWAWDPDYGYYWVPGTWVFSPFVGALWTPGYWGWDPGDAVFVWNEGYWGPVVGFYGGINYGFGYTGEGYEGGYWRDRRFYYNQTVNNINVTNIRNVYRQPVVVRNTSRVSFNGGRGGINARPTPRQMAAVRQRRSGPIQAQTRQVNLARTNPRQRANVNHGRPSIAATPKSGVFRGRGVVPARQAGGAFKPAPGPQRRYTRPGAPGRTPYRPAPGGRQQFAPRGGGRQQVAPGGRGPVQRQITPGGRAPAGRGRPGGPGIYQRQAPQGQQPAPQRELRPAPQRQERQPQEKRQVRPEDNGQGGGPEQNRGEGGLR